MQNFTFGRKGLNWFLFAFILFVGSSSSYGQTSCATISPDQDYCYLETIQDLIDDGVTDSDGDTAVFETADNENDTEPIPDDELLIDGVTYYVGSTAEDCNRVAVEVSVNSEPTPTNTVTGDSNGFTVTPCESSDFSGTDLISLFDPAPADYTLRIYEDEFGDTEIGNYSDPLMDGESYFVGLDPDNTGDCPSQRVAVGVDVVDSPAPTAENPQVVCRGATVADLEAESTSPNFQAFRWYREATGGSPLADNVELVNGEDYFVSQIVNERGSIFPPCESGRTKVVVEVITFDAGGDVTGDICEDNLRQKIAEGEGADILFSFVDDDRDPFPSQVSFDPSLAELAEQFQGDPTQPIITDATFTTAEGCTDVVNFNITINESFNAGDNNIEGNVVCRAFFSEPIATEAEVEAYIRSLFNDAEDDEIDMDGNFSDDDVTTITNLINNGSEGPFTTTYTVGEGEPCEDSANFAFEVDQAPDLGMQTGDGIYCQSEIDERIASTTMYEALARELFLEQLDPSVPQDGDFVDMTLPQVVTAYGNGIRTFSTTYSITTENGCTASVEISFEIIEDTYAGDDNLTDNTACRSEFSTTATEQEVENYLASLLSNDADTDGEFSDLTSIASNITSGDNGPFTSTYTTGGGTECSDTSEFEFSVVDDVAANSGSYGNETLCENDDPLNLFNLDNNDPNAMTTGTFTGEGVTNNVFDPSSVTPGAAYTITYTVSADPENCITGEEFTKFDITVDPAPISANISRELCVVEAIVLISDQSEGYEYVEGILTEAGLTTVDPNNFSGSPLVEAQNLADFIENPTSESDTFTFNYTTLSNNTCEDGNIEINITINNSEDANAGAIEPQTVCFDAGMVNLKDFLVGSGATTGGTFSGPGVSGNMFDSSIGADTYTITYSVSEGSGDCVTPETEDSTDFELTVDLGRELGPRIERSICFAEIDPFLTVSDVEDYYIGLLGDNYSPEGTFTPTPSSLFASYENDPIQTFTTEYSLGTGDCADTLEISVTILATEDADAGDIQNQTVCSNEGMIDLNKFLVDSGATTGGTFSGNGVSNNMFDSSLGSNTTGYEITYEVDDTASCVTDGTSDSDTFIITVTDPVEAEAGDISNKTVCSNEGFINLNDYLTGTGATTGGTFSGTGVTDNMFDTSIGSNEDGYVITYTVSSSNPDLCVTGSANEEFLINIDEAPNAGPGGEFSFCQDEFEAIIAQVIANPSGEGIELLNELDSTITSGGEFSNDTLSELLNQYANLTEYPITFTTTYTVTNENCTASADYSITVNPFEEANAGNIENETVCSDSGMIDLSIYLEGSGATTGGTFSGEGVTDNMFDSSLGSNDSGYVITYSVDDTSSDCIIEGSTDSEEFTIFIEDSFTISAKTEREQICKDNISNLFPGSTAQTTVRNFYLNMLEEDVPTDGEFNPTISQLINRYNTVTKLGDFTTEYTVTQGECTASVELTIEITDTEPAEIGEITDPAPICRNADDVDLFSFLPEDANPNGTFEGYEDGIFSPGMEGEGSFEITYTLTEDSPCTEGTASADFTVTVTESAYAGQNMELSVCTNDDVQNLFDFLSVDADTNGEFSLDGEVIADGMMNPADFEAGDYEVIYTVDEINDCGGDTATFDITVEEAPAAPTVEGNPFTFCATDGATAADLSATGTNLTYYSDEALSMMVAPEDVLVGGTYYVTQRNDEGACESEAAEITVNINDADTPTISNTTQEFCEFDDATLADLTDLVNESGTITWYDSEDGDNALNSGTSLQDGVTYYATLFNVDTGCESSVRLAVTVSINDDCPITIPEAFSPNGDGLNDRFEIRNIRDKYPNFTIEIRNRFGDVVYKGNSNTPDWDGYSTEGSFGSDILPVGAYFYYLRYNDGTTEPVRGTVYLSR